MWMLIMTTINRKQVEEIAASNKCGQLQGNKKLLATIAMKSAQSQVYKDHLNH